MILVQRSRPHTFRGPQWNTRHYSGRPNSDMGAYRPSEHNLIITETLELPRTPTRSWKAPSFGIYVPCLNHGSRCWRRPGNGCRHYTEQHPGFSLRKAVGPIDVPPPPERPPREDEWTGTIRDLRVLWVQYRADMAEWRNTPQEDGASLDLYWYDLNPNGRRCGERHTLPNRRRLIVPIGEPFRYSTIVQWQAGVISASVDGAGYGVSVNERVQLPDPERADGRVKGLTNLWPGWPSQFLTRHSLTVEAVPA